MTMFEYALIGLVVAILGSQWGIHRDLRSLSDRVSKLEGTVELLAKFLIDREHRKTAS